MNISNVNIVFEQNLSVVAFYELNSTDIPDTARHYLFKNAAAKFVKVVISATGELTITPNVANPGGTPSGIYTNIEDVWNTAFEIIVGTGDLRPLQSITINRHSLGGNGIILTSPAAGKLNIYQL
jgi:hypothetical protein